MHETRCTAPDNLTSDHRTPETAYHIPTFRRQKRSRLTTSTQLPLASGRGRCVGCTCDSAWERSLMHRQLLGEPVEAVGHICVWSNVCMCTL